MAVVRVRHITAGYYKLRSEPGVIAKLESMGNRGVEIAGGESAGYQMDSRQGAKRPQGRWRVSMVAVTADAIRDNARNNTLLRALGALREL